MRSLATKLTIAFLAVGLMGALLVVIISNYQVRARFDQFIVEQGADGLSAQLSNHFKTQGDWQEVEAFFDLIPPPTLPGPWILLVDSAENEITHYPLNIEPRFNRPINSIPILVDGVTVATLKYEEPPPMISIADLPPKEAAFLQDVTQTSLISAAIAALCALSVGAVLARSLTRPISSLTEATQKVTMGNFGAQLQVQSQDEIGRLTTSFNQMSRELAEANQQRIQMTADIAHELRTPLSILHGYLEGLKKGELEGSRHLFNILFGEAEQLKHLIQELRTLSLADAGELPLVYELVEPIALLERSGLGYVMQAEAQGVALEIEASDQLPQVSLDLERMTQVINNLVSNALRHTAGGRITLAAYADGNTTIFEVRDSGQGIAAEDLAHIFDRFYRADRSRQRIEHEMGSSGLGLAIAKMIVEAHGGVISAESQLNSGSIFKIRLPNVPH